MVLLKYPVVLFDQNLSCAFSPQLHCDSYLMGGVPHISENQSLSLFFCLSFGFAQWCLPTTNTIHYQHKNLKQLSPVVEKLLYDKIQ